MLSLLNIEETRKTPKVKLDPEGSLLFEGRSIPEDAGLFFDSIVQWVKEYVQSAPTSTVIDIALEYLNSGTSKYMLRVLKILKDLTKDGTHELVVNWFFEDGDDDIIERGEYYASILDIDIQYKIIE